MLPVPPAVSDLLINDNKVSAGWEMMAATTPAIVPEVRAMAILVDPLAVSRPEEAHRRSCAFLERQTWP